MTNLAQIPPDEMSESQRDREIATLFAKGILRLQNHHSPSRRTDSEEPPKSSPDGLELSRGTRLSVPTG